jgi:hypothetical protein
MRSYCPQFLLAILMFGLGYGVDSYLRANVGMNCFGCSTISCKIVTIADNPSIALHHPIDTLSELFYHD